MADREEYKYRAEDFDRYYNGKMTPSEMNALEKAALEDIFLADALEGYANTDSILSDNNDLKTRLLQSKSAGKSKAHHILFSTGFKVAAILIVFAGLCWLLYTNNNSQNDLSLNSPQPGDKKSSLAINPARDTQKISPDSINQNMTFTNGAAVSDGPVKIKNHPDNYTVTASKTEKAGKEAIPSLGLKNGLTNVEADAKNNNVKEISSNIQSGYVPAGNTILKGRITDSHGEPVPFATITDKNTNQATSADNAGTYLLVTKDSTPLVTVSALGFETYTRKVNPDTASTDIVLAEAGVSAGNLLVPPAATKQITEKTDSSSRVILKNAVPLMGWPAFNQYLNKKLKTRQQLAVETPIELTLTFTITNKGKIKDIIPVNGSCKPCVDEASNALRGAMYSLKDKNVKATAVFRF